MEPNIERREVGRKDALATLSNLSEKDFNEVVNTLKRTKHLKDDDIRGSSRQEREEDVLRKSEETLVSSGMERRHAWEAIVDTSKDILK